MVSGSLILLSVRGRLLETDLFRSSSVMAMPKERVGEVEQLKNLLASDSCLPQAPLSEQLSLCIMLLRALVILSCFSVDSLERQGKRNGRYQTDALYCGCNLLPRARDSHEPLVQTLKLSAA